MDRRRMLALGGTGLVVAGLLMAVASIVSVGEAQGFAEANAFAADSVRSVRRFGMLLAVLGLGTLAASTPVLIALVRDRAGQALVTVGWIAFGAGVVLYATVVGVAAITLPALGELAQTGAVSPQAVIDHVIRQTPMVPAFFGANLTYLAWIPIALGLRRSRTVPAWLGPVLATAAVVGWLSFLHVPVLERLGAPIWPLSLALLGAFVLRAASPTDTADGPRSSRSPA